MAKRTKNVKTQALILCADGKSRTQRQIDTKANGERWLALKYWRDRHKHKAAAKKLIEDHVRELERLKKENRDAVNLVGKLRGELNEALHELGQLRKRR